MNNNLRSLNPKNVLKLAKYAIESKGAVLAWKALIWFLGINVIILTDDNEKAELLNIYFAFIFYVKEKDWLEMTEQILEWENWRPRQMGRTESLVLNVFESLPAIVRGLWRVV